MLDNLKIKIHQALKSRTADEFNTLCLLHFEEVYLSFSPGQLLSDKIVVLLDHCVRKPGELARLHQLLLLEAQIVPQPAQITPTYQLPLKHYFDLRNLVDRCYLECEGKTGLFVITVLLDHAKQLIECLGKRVIEILGPTTFAAEHATVHLSYKNTTVQFRRVRNLKSILQAANVLLPFTLDDQATFDQLWHVLKHDLDGIANHICIVLIGLPPGLHLPQDVIQLTPQPLRKPELLEWATQMGYRCGFPHETIELWKTLIWAECATDNQIDIISVYTHMEFAIPMLLEEGTTAMLFHDKLKERSQLYVAPTD